MTETRKAKLLSRLLAYLAADLFGVEQRPEGARAASP